MKRVLIVCTGNTCRSPMAEGILRKLAAERGLELDIASRGLAADEGGAASGYALEALREIGVDLGAHRAHQVLKEELLEADVVYVMTEQHKNVIADALPEVAGRIVAVGIPDPFGRPLERYRECRDELLRFFEGELDERL